MRTVKQVLPPSFGQFRTAYARCEACWPAVLLALCTVIVAGTFATIRVDPHHDGYIFKAALDVAHGKMLYRDTYLQYGAFTVLLPALLLRLVGDYLLAVKLLTAVAYGGIALLLWLLWSRLLPRWLTTLTVVSWLLSAPFYGGTFLAWSSVYALLFQLLAVYFLVLCFQQKRLPYAFTSGAAIAVAVFTRHTVGVAEFLTIAVLLIMLALAEPGERGFYTKCLKRLIFSFLLTDAVLLAWLGVNGALQTWWAQTIRGPFQWSQTVGGGFSFSLIRPTLLPTWIPIDGMLWSAIPVVTLLVLVRETMGVFGSRGASPASRVILLAAAVGLSGWHQYYPVTDFRHCFWAATPMMVFIPYLVWSSLRAELPVFRTFATLTAVGLAFYPSVELRVKIGLKKLGESYVTVRNPAVLAGIRLLPGEALAYEKLSQIMQSYLMANPKSNVVVADAFPLLLTLSPNVRNVPSVYSGDTDVGAIYENYITKEKPMLIAADVSRPGYKSLAFFPKEVIFGPEAYLFPQLGLHVAAPVAVTPSNLVFEILKVQPGIKDEIGRFDAQPDGVLDQSIDIRVTRGSGQIDVVRVEAVREDGGISGRWETTSGTIWWMVGIYRNGEVMVSRKMPSVSLPVAAGQELQLRVTGNSVLPGLRLVVTFLLHDGNAVQASTMAPATK